MEELGPGRRRAMDYFLDASFAYFTALTICSTYAEIRTSTLIGGFAAAATLLNRVFTGSERQERNYSRKQTISRILEESDLVELAS